MPTSVNCSSCGRLYVAPDGFDYTTQCFGCGTTIVFGTGSDLQPIVGPTVEEKAADIEAAINEQGATAWEALHSMINPHEEDIELWLTTVPAYGCGCSEFAREYVKANPPPYGNKDAFRHWTWEFHDYVDQHTGDERMSYIDAVARWGW